MKNFTMGLFAFFASLTFLIAQPINTPTLEKTLAVAKELEEKNDYLQALEWYEKAYEESEERSLLYPISLLSIEVRDYRKAERRLRSILRRDEGLYPDAKYLYGRMLKMNEKYDEAILELKDFIVETSDPQLKKKAQLELAGAEMGKNMPPAAGFEIESVGKDINNKQGQYSPTLVGDTKMFYASFDTDDLIVMDDENEEAFVKIYEANKSEKGWDSPSVLDQKINRPGFHNSNVHVTADGERMYFTRALLQGNKLRESKIMFTQKGDGGWQGAEELAGVNSDSLSKHPAIGELFGREVLFFSSNREGGEGGFDLYYATRNGDGTYGDPINLKEINTPYDDESPFFREGTLYFSTEGYPTLGGLDVFYSLWDGTDWSAPANMGKGINSSVDDIYFSLDGEGYRGVLVSNREGTRSVGPRTCCNDIFEFEIPKITASIVVGTFTEDKKPLKGASVSIEEVEINDPFSQSNAEGNVFNFPLAVERSYKIVATHPGYFPDSVEVNTLGITETSAYEHRFYLTQMPPPPPPEPEFDTIFSEQPIELSNIYYDFNEDVILKEAEQDLEFILELMNKYPEMKIELRSHTDARGDNAYNQQLSQSRTESARRWLVRRDVPRSRMEAKGYGETEPKTVTEQNAADHPFLQVGDVLTEAYINKLESVEQQEAAHRLNRRTEFQILEGPKSIEVKRTRLRKQNGSGGPKAVEPKIPVRRASQNVITPHRLSSLYGKKDLTGFPMMHFDKRVIDFGTVKKGEKRTHVYAFTNLGDTTMEIDFVDHCDCTEVDYPRLPIAPGKSGEIKIVFDSKDKDEAETISVDIFLKQVDPANGYSIYETVQYVFEVEK